MRVPLNPPLVVTQPFGVPEAGSAFGLHSGIDYAAALGTPVYACISGTISIAQNDQYHGNVVDIHNGDKWYRVMHLSSFKKTSGAVNEGDLIALSGNTGFSTGPHVHWDVRTQFIPTSFQAFINPLTLLEEEDVYRYPNEGDLTNNYNRTGWPGHPPNANDIAFWTKGTNNPNWGSSGAVWAAFWDVTSKYVDANPPIPATAETLKSNTLYKTL